MSAQNNANVCFLYLIALLPWSFLKRDTFYVKCLHKVTLLMMGSNNDRAGISALIG